MISRASGARVPGTSGHGKVLAMFANRGGAKIMPSRGEGLERGSVDPLAVASPHRTTLYGLHFGGRSCMYSLRSRERND